MSASVGARDIVTDKLVLYFDCANYKSYTFGENLLYNSENVTLWSNNGNAFLLTANADTAPNGTLTATTLEQTAVTGASRWVSSINSFKYISGSTYTLSGYLRKVSGTDTQPAIYLWAYHNGLNYAQSVGTLTTDWQRYSFTFVAPLTNTALGGLFYTGMNTSFDSNGAANNFKFAAWGFQLERRGTAGTYIKTGANPVKNNVFDLAISQYSGSIQTNSSSLVVAGPGYSSEKNGALVFNGTDDRLVYNGFPSVSDGISVSCFVKPTGLSSSDVAIMGKNNNLLSITSTRIYWWPDINLSPENPTIQNDNDIWCHIGVTQSGSNCVIYKNGKPVHTNSATQQFSTGGTQYTTIGAYNLGTSRFFSGSIASVAVYHRVLTQEEMLQNYNSLKTRFGLT